MDVELFVNGSHIHADEKAERFILKMLEDKGISVRFQQRLTKVEAESKRCFFTTNDSGENS